MYPHGELGRSTSSHQRTAARAPGRPFGDDAAETRKRGGRTVGRNRRAQRSSLSPQIGAQQVFRRGGELHGAVAALRLRQRVRGDVRGGALAEPPRPAPRVVAHTEAATASRAAPRLNAQPPPRASRRRASCRGPSPVHRRSTARRRSSRSASSAARSRRAPGASSGTSPRGTPAVARRFPRRAKPPRPRASPPTSRFCPPTAAPRPSPARARRACAAVSRRERPLVRAGSGGSGVAQRRGSLEDDVAESAPAQTRRAHPATSRAPGHPPCAACAR